jgi:hypothetical protein
MLKSPFFNSMIAAASHDVGDVDQSPVRTALLEAAASGSLKSHIESILSDQTVCELLASESYLHPNGFEKFGLYPATESRVRIRLHVWRSENRGLFDDANYHSHVRDFASLVVTGELTDSLYAEMPTSVDGCFQAFKYEVMDRPVGGEYRFAEMGTAQLVNCRSRLIGSGSAYSLPFTQIHRTSISIGDTVRTVFVQGPERSQSSLVYSNLGYRVAKDSGAGRLSVADFIGSMTDLLKLL